MSKVRVEVESERGALGKSARVLVYENDKLIAEVIGKIEPQRGADGRAYPTIVLTRNI